MGILCALLTAYWVVLLARAIMSWFPIRPGSPFATIYSVVHDVTEPVLAPVRRVIPPVGMLDLSFLVVLFGVLILQSVVC